MTKERAYRKRLAKRGGRLVQVVLTAEGVEALDAIVTAKDVTKSAAVNAALVKAAKTKGRAP